jgi:hypothetical protein
MPIKLQLSNFSLLGALLSISMLLTGCGAGPYSFPSGTILNSSVSGTQNPLVAAYSIQTALECAGQVAVEFGPDTTYGRMTAWYPTTGNLEQSTILVAGMRASTTYHMRALAQCPGDATPIATADTTFTTGPLPALPFPTLTVTRPNPVPGSPENPGVEMIDITSAGTPALYTDRDGNPIWYYDVGSGNYPFPFKLLSNGHMLVNISSPTDSTLREIDLAGNTIREMDINALAQKTQSLGYDFVPRAFHHDFLQLDNGHFIVLVFWLQTVPNSEGFTGPIQGDALIDLDENWNPVWSWNSLDHMDINRHLNGLPDWTHGNAVVYSPSDGNLLLSMRHQSWVLKIDYNNGSGTGNILWHLGYQGDFALTNNGVPTDDPSLWFSFQHFPTIISQSGSQTTLAVWDNGDNRVLDSSGTLCSTPPAYIPCYSRAAVMNLNDSQTPLVADLLWADVDPFYGVWGGSVNQLSNGNVEFDLNDPAFANMPNLASQVQEVTQNPTPQVVWQMNISPITSTAYRAYRAPSLYPAIAWPY